MEDTVFQIRFAANYVKQVDESSMQKPAVFLYDGHGSHLTYETIRGAMRNEVIIIFLEPHISHALHPLNVGLFKLFETQR